MKLKINLHKLFQRLDPEDLNSDIRLELSEQIDLNRIHKLTMDMVREEKESNLVSIKKNWIKAAVVLCSILCLTGATVYAASKVEIRETISNMLGISQTEILNVGRFIENKDYKLTVHEITCDSYIGWITVSIEALSIKSQESFSGDKLIDKLGHIGSVGYSIRQLEELNEGYTKYFLFSFRASKEYQYEDGLTFTMDGFKQKIEIPITKTIALSEKNIEVAPIEGYPVAYDRILYSELGFTILGRIEKEGKQENQKIVIELLDGTRIDFYHKYEQGQLGNESSEAVSVSNGKTNISSSLAEPSKEDFSKEKDILAFDEAWFSGSSHSSNGEDEVTTSYIFSKKVDWATVKSITINNTKIHIN